MGDQNLWGWLLYHDIVHDGAGQYRSAVERADEIGQQTVCRLSRFGSLPQFRSAGFARLEEVDASDQVHESVLHSDHRSVVRTA